MRSLCGILLTAVLAAAQSSPGSVSFEAAIVKAAVPIGSYNVPYKRITPVRVEYRNYPLRRLIAEAFGLADYQVEGPAWIAWERYEVTAIKPRSTSTADFRGMMQSLLIERFHLTSHRDSKEMAAYQVVVEKAAVLRPAHEESAPPLGCESIGTLREFAAMVSRILNSPVVDKTNIPGTFYFMLAWNPALPAGNDLAGRAPPPPAAPPPCPGFSAKTMPPLAHDIRLSRTIFLRRQRNRWACESNAKDAPQ